MKCSYHIIEVALVNTHMLYKESGNTMATASFRELVMKGLLRRTSPLNVLMLEKKACVLILF